MVLNFLVVCSCLASLTSGCIASGTQNNVMPQYCSVPMRRESCEGQCGAQRHSTQPSTPELHSPSPRTPHNQQTVSPVQEGQAPIPHATALPSRPPEYSGSQTLYLTSSNSKRPSSESSAALGFLSHLLSPDASSHPSTPRPLTSQVSTTTVSRHWRPIAYVTSVLRTPHLKSSVSYATPTPYPTSHVIPTRSHPSNILQTAFAKEGPAVQTAKTTVEFSPTPSAPGATPSLASSTSSSGDRSTPSPGATCSARDGRAAVQVYACQCDRLCPIYGDCCADYYRKCLDINPLRQIKMQQLKDNLTHSLSSSPENSNFGKLISRMTCTEFSPYPGQYYYMIAKCDDSEDRPRQQINRRHCEGRVFRHNVTGYPVALLQDRKVVFRNVYCARCNGYGRRDLDRRPYLSLHCAKAVHIDQKSIQEALGNHRCSFVVNSTIAPLFRACPSPRVVKSTCDEAKWSSCQEYKIKRSVRKLLIKRSQANSSDTERNSDKTFVKGSMKFRYARFRRSCANRRTFHSGKLPFARINDSGQNSSQATRIKNRKQSRKKRSKKANMLKSTSQFLCSTYLRLVSDSEHVIYANPDCLVCSRGIHSPQILDSIEVETLGMYPAVPTAAPFAELMTPSAGNCGKYPTMSTLAMTTTVSGGMGGVPSFTVFFKLGDSDWNYVVDGQDVSPQIVSCRDDEVYVPYYSECEHLDCAPHTYPFRGRCLVEDWNAADSLLQPLPNGTHRVYLTVNLERITDTETGRERLEDTTTHLGRMADTETNFTQFLSLSDLDFNWTTCNDVDSLINGTNITFFNYTYLFGKAGHHLSEIQVTIEKGENASIHDIVDLSTLLMNQSCLDLFAEDVKIQSVFISNMDEARLQEQQCPNGSLEIRNDTVLDVDGAGSYFVLTGSPVFYTLENIGFVLQTYPAVNATPVLVEVAICEENVLSDLPDCSGNGSILIKASDFTTTNTSLTFDGNVYEDGEFVKYANGSARVCNIFKSTFEILPKFVMVKGYLTEIVLSTVTLSISMLSLVLVLLTYSLLPQLRNVPGVIVMSYSGSLLASQGLILMAMIPTGWMCVLYACVVHAVLLSSFLWKSLLGFDLAFMLRIQSIESSSHAKRVYMLRWYTAVGWLLPVLFVTCLWLLDYYGVYYVGYGPQGAGACWMGSSQANLFFIIVPLAVTWVFNGVCFVLALRMIYQSGRVLGNAAKSKGQDSADRRRLAAYCRLTVLMGVTWLVCFAGTVWDLRALWLANILLNASQGVHVLVCFVIKRRVLAMLRDRLSSLLPRRAKSTSDAAVSRDTTQSSLAAVSTVSTNSPGKTPTM